MRALPLGLGLPFQPVPLLSFPIFWLLHTARGILVPRPGIEPAVEVPSLNHWPLACEGKSQPLLASSGDGEGVGMGAMAALQALSQLGC